MRTIMQHFDAAPEGWAPPFDYAVKGCGIVDGDTVDLTVDLGFRMTLEDRFRLAAFDAWEKRRPTLTKGKAAAARLQQIVDRAIGLRVVTEKDLHDRAKRGKYGRYIATLYVFSPSDYGDRWVDVTEILEREGHAKRETDDAADQ